MKMGIEKIAYNSYSINGLKKLMEIAKDFVERDLNIQEQVNEMFCMGYTDTESLRLINAFMTYGDRIILEEKMWYRIGEPDIDTYGRCYKPSYNFAEDCREIGVSVITKEWMENLKSVFFGAHDNKKIKSRGVYKIKGILIGFGGDDEPLIYPTDWAEKTKICSISGIMKAIH